MAVYSYTEDSIRAMIASRKKSVMIVCFVTAPLLLILWWFRFAHLGSEQAFFIPLNSVLCVALVNSVWRYKKRLQQYERKLRETWVSIAPGQFKVSLLGMEPIEIDPCEIVRAEERSWTYILRLCTKERYRSYAIPRKIDGYELLRAEIATAGIPIETKRFLPNWEEFAAVFAFCAATLCTAYSRNAWILGISAVVLFLFALFCYSLWRVNPHIPASLRWKGLAMFVFVIPAIIAFWHAITR